MKRMAPLSELRGLNRHVVRWRCCQVSLFYFGCLTFFYLWAHWPMEIHIPKMVFPKPKSSIKKMYCTMKLVSVMRGLAYKKAAVT